MIPIASIDISGLLRSIDAVEAKGKTLGPVFRSLRKDMRGDQRQHDKDEQGPDGPWKPRSPVTEARRIAANRAGRRMRRLTAAVALRKSRRQSTPKKILGRLPRALIVTSTALSVVARSRATFGGAHNAGARVGRGRRVTLPRREFLWLGKDLVETARDRIVDAIVRAWGT